jgi:hypothetical protein
MTIDPSTTSPEADTDIEFVGYHRPPLLAGSYEITVAESVVIDEVEAGSFSLVRQFSVLGTRYALAPTDVHDVFPPEGSLGEHSNVFPHVVLNRSTLPWEREPLPGPPGDALPWIALLLLTAEEEVALSTVTLGSLRNPSSSPYWPGLQPVEVGEDDTTQLQVIDLKRSLAESLLPRKTDLPLLAHVRRATDGDLVDPKLVELAVIIGNRLPKPGASSTVHLVALEGRYGDGDTIIIPASVAADDQVRLLSLKSWRFACVDEKKTFTKMLRNVSPYVQGQIPDGATATLQLPPSGNALADSLLTMGSVALRHTLRDGSATVSWYRGPLIPWDNKATVDLPVRTSDELVRYLPAMGMFDTTYAAAWELGRLLMLQNKQISVSLYHWKRANAQQLRQREQLLLHLPFVPATHDVLTDERAQSISDWFDQLNLLQGVPFNYLVPDERMFPAESIRFFWLDPVWTDCLLDGAFSIGRISAAEHQRDSHFTDSPAESSYDTITGFLLRSDAVSGWPGMLVTGLGADGAVLPTLRMARLSSNVLLCLFRGEIATVSLREKPETLHFGLDKPNGTRTSYFKMLRDPDNSYKESEDLVVTEISWRQLALRTVDMKSLATVMANALPGLRKTPPEPLTAAQFALQMVEGVQEVLFVKAPVNAPSRPADGGSL